MPEQRDDTCFATIASNDEAMQAMHQLLPLTAPKCGNYMRKGLGLGGILLFQ